MRHALRWCVMKPASRWSGWCRWKGPGKLPSKGSTGGVSLRGPSSASDCIHAVTAFRPETEARRACIDAPRTVFPSRDCTASRSRAARLSATARYRKTPRAVGRSSINPSLPTQKLIVCVSTTYAVEIARRALQTRARMGFGFRRSSCRYRHRRPWGCPRRRGWPVGWVRPRWPCARAGCARRRA